MRPSIPKGGFKSAEEQVQYYIEREKRKQMEKDHQPTDNIILPILGFIRASDNYSDPSTYSNGFEGLYVVTDENDVPCGINSLNGTYGTEQLHVNYNMINISPSVIKVMARDAAVQEIKSILEDVIDEEIQALKKYIDSSAKDLISQVMENGAGSNGVTEKTLVDIVKTITNANN